MNREEDIAKIVRAHGAEFYDTETVEENGHTIYRVYITQKDGVDLDTCAEISNDLSPMLDINPPVSGNYFLEVSSPGLERVLKKPSHFKNAIGERVKLKVAEKGKVRGIIANADDEGILLKNKEGESRYSYPSIQKARTYIDWSNKK